MGLRRLAEGVGVNGSGVEKALLLHVQRLLLDGGEVR